MPGTHATTPAPSRRTRPRPGTPARAARPSGVRAARRRDRRVYSHAHPLLFALLAAARRRPVVRLGRTVLVHDADAYRHALTRLPLDRTAAGTTGGAVRAHAGEGALFDQEGNGHRGTRRTLADDLGSAGVERLRPVWQRVIARHLAPLATGGETDLATLAHELAGATVCALLGVAAAPGALARAAAEAAAATVRDHLPGPRRPGAARAAARATARLETLLAQDRALPGPPGTAGSGRCAADPSEPHGRTGDGLRAMVAVAAVTTTVAALPRAAAWCADAGLWEQAGDRRTRDALVGELLRVTAPSPLLPRVAAAPGTLGGRPVRGGDRLVLVARHAVRAHRDAPCGAAPAPAAVAHLVFGAGPHACPGARLARAQLADLLAALAPYRPAVVRARTDRRAALPAWRTLTVRADPRTGTTPGGRRGTVPEGRRGTASQYAPGPPGHGWGPPSEHRTTRLTGEEP
ncbi:cytochrome P450 [Streptomyces diacarni]|uniref:cytochrome P450 n=1 Tax=Streptomyces diacarni TaxID=2800381 RepID=UPI001C68FEEF|nr:cytochrome P450 [Streptomyces diacarni]